MKANELRIGNWVRWFHPENGFVDCKVDIDILQTMTSEYFENSDIEVYQIPLTEDLLLKFGFEKSDVVKTESVCYRKKDFALTKSGKKWHVHRFVCVNTGNDGMAFLLVSIENVHELQNTYSCLMKGEELELKE